MSTIRISRTVAAAPERVFVAWTDAAQLAAWWWPQLVDAGTLVTVAHTSTAHVAGGGAEQGWNDVLDRLVRMHASQSTSSRS
jgi:hypothetical protein